MDCSLYRKNRPLFPHVRVEVTGTAEYLEWFEHRSSCDQGGDWELEQRLAGENKSSDEFPCVHVSSSPQADNYVSKMIHFSEVDHSSQFAGHWYDSK